MNHTNRHKFVITKTAKQVNEKKRKITRLTTK